MSQCSKKYPEWKARNNTLDSFHFPISYGIGIHWDIFFSWKQPIHTESFSTFS